MSELKNIVTPDELMEEFVSDMVVADDELSDSIFTCVDNYIDDLCITVMDDEENGIMDSDANDAELPFTYILDKVIEKVDTIENIQIDSYCKVIEKQLKFSDDDDTENKLDPDYCEGVDFDEITPEDFQLDIRSAVEDREDSHFHRSNDYDSVFDDANFNA